MKIKTMMILTITSSQCFSTSLHAAMLEGCGFYKVEGIVREDKLKVKLIVNEKSVSEIKFSAPFNWETKLRAYINDPVTVQLKIEKRPDGTLAEIHSIQEISLRVPDPMSFKPEDLKLIKKAGCR